MSEGRFENDTVEGFTPISFAVELTRRLRRNRGIAHTPSLRTTLAIPRFLTARYFRTRRLSPNDYIEAAVLNTVSEDQAIAEALARELLFPKATDEPRKTAAPDEPSVASEAIPAEEDPTAAILGDISGLDIDFDNLDDLTDLETILDEQQEHALEAFDLFETLYSSAEHEERSLGELVAMFGGPAELEACGAHTIPTVKVFVREMLRARLGELTAEHVKHAVGAGFGPLLLQEASMPWELAGALAGAGTKQGLDDHLEDLLDERDARTLGKTILFLKPHLDDADVEVFAGRAMAQARDLAEFGELLVGLERYEEPPMDLMHASVTQNMHRAIVAGEWIEETFGHSLTPRLFEMWADRNPDADLDELVDNAVDCDRWKTLIAAAYDVYVAALIRASAVPTGPTDLPAVLIDAIAVAHRLKSIKPRRGLELARHLGTEILCLVAHRHQFLPVLDELLDLEIIPDDVERIVEHAKSLGVTADDVYDRIGDALKQLEQMVLNDIVDADRYKLLVSKLSQMPFDLAEQLAKVAMQNGNLEGMAALLALNMGAASAAVGDDDFVLQALGYKGIGGGTNLLKQWFTHKTSLGSGVRDQIKAMAKDALMSLAFDWITKGEGSAESGLVPQQHTRGYAAGDDLELLDIEGTLDAIIGNGKRLDDINEEDLVVSDTSRGQAALAVLIDISGSMSGSELAICAIAVVMLLGKVRSNEIALAAFESDTHVIKNFRDERDLDEVADEVLELAATGGTRVDAALRWATEQFAAVNESEFRLLFLLSDFCFWEDEKDLATHARRLADLGLVLLAASHGYVQKPTLDALLGTIGGRNLELKSVEKLPLLLVETLKQIADGAFR